MIIQHNLMALNAHRQLSGNNSLVSKNLEKLSSGYKINRAADDAAGLAISEKMRAQITGLTRAQANAQDGISLVQTAEGALTEVHSMLNRMVDLATQSSNGTLQSDDRQKIQDEMDSLTGEIDRISKSTNFNGINLLDGSLGGGPGTVNLTGAKIAGAAIGTLSSNAATANVFTSGALTQTGVVGAKAAEVTIEYTKADGTTSTKDISFESGTSAALSFDALKAAIEADDDLKDLFEVGGTATGLTLTSKATGAAGTAAATKMTVKTPGADTVALATGTAAPGTDANMSVDGAGDLAVGDSFTLNGKTFEFVAAAGDATTGKNAIAVVVGGADADSVTNLSKALSDAGTGIKASVGAGNVYTFAPDRDAKAKGLVLQIGDTADEFNKVTVSVADMGIAGLGINNIRVTEQGVSSEAIQTIKDAIETVSVNRSAMGAMQNRLEHTINNLGVATENMTAAESRIRDVDMAKEMMHFTKNNVLAQAAQSMLAQANQQPQQVLQLLR